MEWFWYIIASLGAGIGTGQAAALTCLIIIVLVYPLLSALEAMPWYGRFFVQKSPGEAKRSLLMLFFMFAAVIAVSWGLFHAPYAAAAAILMWGTGDAAAALVGVPFGRHKVKIRHLNGKKSWEGSCAMLLVSALTGTGILLYGGYPVKSALPCVLTSAAAGTIAELASPGEWDTVTVPVIMLITALILL